MPSGRDWVELFRSTFRDVSREDIGGLYSLQWKHAKEKLTAQDREALAKGSGQGGWNLVVPLRRFFKTANSVLFGLSKRLAPARRVLFLGVLLCLLFSFNGPSFSRQMESSAGGTVRTTEYHFYFDNGLLLAACVLLGLLLAMELVDKINYRDELELARDLQASLIPRELPGATGLELGACNEIANTVGGDIYDFVPLSDGRLAVLFGDASGHGMAAGLIMAVAHAAFRTQLEVDPAPPAMFATLNRILCRTGSPRAFFGCIYLLFARDGCFTGSVAGHPPALRLSADGAVRERVGKGAYPLGIRPGLSWLSESGRLEPSETLFLHSDGLSEARNAAGEEFGDARIEAAIRRGTRLSPPALAADVVADLHAFCGRQAPEDDVSVAVIRRTQAPSAMAGARGSTT
jgi:serine phosphatase RsbU (regulator of sigma subunit)